MTLSAALRDERLNVQSWGCNFNQRRARMCSGGGERRGAYQIIPATSGRATAKAISGICMSF